MEARPPVVSPVKKRSEKLLLLIKACERGAVRSKELRMITIYSLFLYYYLAPVFIK